MNRGQLTESSASASSRRDWLRLRSARKSAHAGLALSEAHRSQVAARQKAACLHAQSMHTDDPGSDSGPVVARIMSAAPGYLLAHGSGDIARHCHLLTPTPMQGQVRVVVTPGRTASEWRLDVASRDRPGLLAAFTGVLAARYLDVTQAVIATWDDGAALQAFTVRSTVAPDAALLQAACELSLTEPLRSEPLVDASVGFDHGASDLYTRCDVRATDRVGLLHSIAVAIASSGADVHAASVSTADGVALDRFDISTREGTKVDRVTEELIADLIRNGVTARQLSGGRDRRLGWATRRKAHSNLRPV
jgi:UTP:GlnB (protein PII) uridylyltransferase